MTRRVRHLLLLAIACASMVLAACTPDEIALWNNWYDSQPKAESCVGAMHAVWPQHLWGWAERKIDAESGGDPGAQNRSSSAAGCFQIIRGTWNSNAACDWSARYDAMCNVKTAWILYQRAGRSPWAASGG